MNYGFEDVRQRSQTNISERYYYKQFKDEYILVVIVVYDSSTAATMLRQQFSSETFFESQRAITQDASDVRYFRCCADLCCVSSPRGRFIPVAVLFLSYSGLI